MAFLYQDNNAALFKIGIDILMLQMDL